MWKYPYSRNLAHTPSSSSPDCMKLWKAIWGLDVPPRIRLFAWGSYARALPSAHRLGSRIPNFSIHCGICGALEETNVHALVECPLARRVWEGSAFMEWLEAKPFTSVQDLFNFSREHFDSGQ